MWKAPLWGVASCFWLRAWQLWRGASPRPEGEWGESQQQHHHAKALCSAKARGRRYQSSIAGDAKTGCLDL
ncbi:hypothetical protein Y1Q_0014902 [Alligator mississippiensis]|uniref:Secreted protein n=1 Tax=Alligator mississippiensis TaxID=8496 RepID=A0A151N8L4_ALLMI|nr:hypothetical protein Y1Q_0014902 [Alligator mississippiensis]